MEYTSASSHPILVLGHKNPDTDSICAAIAYARLKETLDPGRRYLPCRAGLVNRETAFALDHFGVRPPQLCTDVSPQLRDADYRHDPGVSPEVTLREAWQVLKERNTDTLCVVDEQEHLLGLTTLKDMGRLYMDLIDACLPARADPQAALGAITDALTAPLRSYMVTDELMTFTPNTPVDTLLKTIANVRYHYFPVVDEHRRYLGMLSRRNLLNLRKKQLILVDHNEKSQAVDGLDEAEVLEVVDHHRLGALETAGPVYFRCVPVGASCTIVYQLYRENGLIPDRVTAGLLLSAILSDTLMFRSPTCTPVDEQVARELAGIAGVDMEPYAQAMFERGGDVSGKSPEEVLRTDYKIFSSGPVRFGVAHVSFMNAKNRSEAEALLAPYLASALAKQGLDYLFCMLTLIPTAQTRLIMAGAGAEELAGRAFRVPAEGGVAVLEGVVSRKKQVIPALLGAIRQQTQL